MKHLHLLAQRDSIRDLLKAKATARSWNAVALAILLRDQLGKRPSAPRITSADTAHLATLLLERCEVKP